VIVVTDGSKIGQAAFARICGIERVHDLITDAGAPADALAEIAAAGVAITTV
jgi:DeoR family transcriptional regulator of aga operon